MAKTKAKDHENSKKTHISIEINPVENNVMYSEDFTANLYVFLKIMLIYISNLYPTPLMVLNKSSPIFSLNFRM